MAPELGIGMVGYAFMGAAHSQAWRNAHRFFDLPLTPRMAVLGGRTEDAVRAAAARLGWEDVETDWRRLVVRDDVDLVDVGTPGDSEGAAGSIYIDVPVTVRARLKDGTRQRFTGHYTLRRVNDVPGSTRAQRRWHLYSAELKAQ